MVDAGVGMWLVAILLVGLFGFIVMIVALLFHAFRAVLRALFGRRRVAGGQGSHEQKRYVTCKEPSCRHSNPPTALYCGRCGRSLRQAYDVDAYG